MFLDEQIQDYLILYSRVQRYSALPIQGGLEAQRAQDLDALDVIDGVMAAEESTEMRRRRLARDERRRRSSMTYRRPASGRPVVARPTRELLRDSEGTADRPLGS